MAVHYGLLKGKVIDGIRAEVMEEQVNQTNRSYQSNHFHLIIQVDGVKWRCPVNIRSQDKSEVWFTIQDVLREHPILEDLPDIPEGLLELPQRRPGRTLDYVREPLFDRTAMRHLPQNVAGANNDIQDHLELYVKQAQTEPGAIAYVFGSYWRDQQFPPDKIVNTTHGVHDIHMNQGNDDRFCRDDGVYQDGGLIFYFPQTNRYVGIFLAFNSQVWFTDNQSGHRLAGYVPGPHAGGTDPSPSLPTPLMPSSEAGEIRIIAALINPPGADEGRETVTLFNAGGTPVTLDGWKIRDRQNHTEDLAGTHIESNQSVTVRLSGRGVQLSNRGGFIQIYDPGNRLVHVVTYTKKQASQGKIIVFSV